jgi:hypothetical protein
MFYKARDAITYAKTTRLSLARILRWVLVAGFVLLVLTRNAALLKQRPAAELVIEITAGVPSLAKIYFDTGHGFAEAESAVQMVSAGPIAQRLFFPLPAKTIHSIRFDPLETSGIVQISDAFIQRPRTHVLLRRFDLSQVTPRNEIASLVIRDGSLEITTTGDSTDSQLLLPWPEPLTIRHSPSQIFSGRFFRVNGIWLFFGILLLVTGRLRSRWWPGASRLLRHFNRALTVYSQRFAGSPVFPLDRIALWFYTLCFALFLSMAIAGLHGSSISIYSSIFPYSTVKHQPLLGKPKVIRIDEWNYHTPTILNQVLRRDRFAADSSLFGPHKAALFGNVPTRHWTEWFRPQFWGFHCLAPAAAYASYWQTKGLLLLTGTFSLLLLLTRSSVAALFGALWYFFSAYTQWSYSWPTLLPEMVGLFGWVICLGAYLTVGRSRWRLTLASLLCALFAIDFALCCYPSHQFPLVILGLATMGWWLLAHAGLVFRKEGWRVRSLAVAGCFFSIALVLGLFYFDAKAGFVELARTIYPGQRSSGGGGVTAAQMLSHFMDFWKTEARFPTELGNICEGTGYLWLAPVTLLMPWPTEATRRIKLANLFLWLAFLFLAVWMLLPIPAAIGAFLFFDKVLPHRCLPALGLINIAIVVLYVSTMDKTPATKAFMLCKEDLTAIAGILILVLITFACMNSVYHQFFTYFEIAIAAVYAAFLITCLRKGWRRLLAAALLLPAAASISLVNPVDRGFDVIFKSSLSATIERQPELRNGRWLVFSSWFALPGFVSASGLDLINGLKIIPAMDELILFDPEGKYGSVLNQSCYLRADVQTETGPSEFESPSPGVVIWKVNPFDPKLKEIGVKYLAFDAQPDSSIRQKLKPILAEESHKLWIYELL